jgi:hypothetical protein
MSLPTFAFCIKAASQAFLAQAIVAWVSFAIRFLTVQLESFLQLQLQLQLQLGLNLQLQLQLHLRPNLYNSSWPALFSL